MVANPAQNNVASEFTIAFSVVEPIVASGSLVLGVPYQNSQFSGLGITPSRSMVVSSGTITANTYYESSGIRTSTSASVSIS